MALLEIVSFLDTVQFYIVKMIAHTHIHTHTAT